MKNIFETFTFPSGATIQNRLVLAPMTTYSSNDDLTLSEEEKVYYHEKAKGLGLVITAATAVSKQAQAFPNQISVRDERYLESMKELAQSIQSAGSKAVLQLHHGGRMNQAGLYPNQEIVAPSAIKAERKNAVTPRELKTSEVYDIIDDFVNATRLAIQAGFDGVELHGANTYLIQQFFSPHSNRRDDEFGGSVEKRMRFIKTLVNRVLIEKEEHASDDFIIGYRFSPEEYETPGIQLDDTKKLVDYLASKPLDYLHISLGTYDQTPQNKEDDTPIAKQLINIINNRVPFIGVGHIETKEDASNALDMGYDLIALGLIALSDSNVANAFKQNMEPSKVFSKDSHLPKAMFERLHNWGKSLEERGYKFN